MVLEPHWTFAQSAARIGIDLLLLNPTLRLTHTAYLDIATAFCTDAHLSLPQRQAWQQLRTRLCQRIAIEQRHQEPLTDAEN